jgi:hypothetical protein
LAIRVDNISDEHLLEAYMGGLKEDIKHDIFLKHHKVLWKLCNFLAYSSEEYGYTQLYH